MWALAAIYIAPAVSSETALLSIPVGLNPANLAITPNGAFAYVVNNNNNSVPGADTVSVINLKTNKVVATISDPSFNEPYTVTINAAGTKAYVTNSNSTTVTIINIATNTVTGVIDGFDGPSGFAITPDGSKAYVNNYGGPSGVGSGNGTTVNIVDLTANIIIGDPIEVGLAPASLAAGKNGKFVYVINYVDGNPGTGTMSIISTVTNTTVETIKGFSGPFAIAITPNGLYAYVTNFGSNNFAPVGRTVGVVNLLTNTVVAEIEVGVQPSGIAFSPNGRLAYVTNYNTLYLGPNFTNLTAGEGTVNIIDTCTRRVLRQEIVVGKSPAAIAVAPNGQRAYTTNYTSNDVSVLNVCDRMWLK